MRSIAELKTSILQSIAQTDDEKILTDIQNYVTGLLKKQKKIVAYNSKGDALTLDEYQASLEEARQEYKRNEIISQDDMEKQV